MTTAQNVNEAAEAICQALHETEFRFLGDNGPATWFTRGTKPRVVRVGVMRLHRERRVRVGIEWLIPTPGDPVKGSQHFELNVDADSVEGRRVTKKNATELVARVLEIYRDVLANEGVAAYEHADAAFKRK